MNGNKQDSVLILYYDEEMEDIMSKKFRRVKSAEVCFHEAVLFIEFSDEKEDKCISIKPSFVAIKHGDKFLYKKED